MTGEPHQSITEASLARHLALSEKRMTLRLGGMIVAVVACLAVVLLGLGVI